MHPETPEDGGEVVADGVLTEKEVAGDGGGPLAGHKSLEDLMLTWGEFGQEVEIPRVTGGRRKQGEAGRPNFRRDSSQAELEVAHTASVVVR